MTDKLKTPDTPDEDISKGIPKPVPHEPEPTSAKENIVPTWAGQRVTRTKRPRSAKAL
jgi:hypothetical protein